MNTSFRLLCAPLLLLALLLGGAVHSVTAQRVDWAQKLQDDHAPTDGVGGMLAVDRAGNTYLTGYFAGTFTLGGLTVQTPSSGNGQVYIAKLDSTGTAIWLKQSEGAPIPNGHAVGTGIAVDTLGNLFLSGYWINEFHLGAFTLNNQGSFIAKLDAATGTCQWLRPLNNQLGNSGGARCGLTQILVDQTGDCLLIGHAYETDSLGSFPLIKRDTYDPLLARIAPDGQLRWVRQMHGARVIPPSYYDRLIVDAAVDGVGNCVVVGGFHDTLTVEPGRVLLPDTSDWGTHGSGINTDPFAVKYDRHGNVQWTKQGYGSGHQSAAHVAVDTRGNVLVSMGDYSNAPSLGFDGHTFYRMASTMMKFDGAGAFQWTMGRPDGLEDGPICTDSDDNVYMTSRGMVINCFNPDGTARWQFQYPITRTDWKFYAVNMVIDAARNLYVYGGADSVATVGNIRLQGSYYDVLGRISPRANELTGRVFLDADADGQFDATEQGFPRSIPIDAGPGSSYASYARSGYRIFTGLGAYDVRLAYVPRHHTLTTPASYSGNFTNYGGRVDNLNFGLVPVANQQDLRVTLTPYSPARRGIPIRYQARVENVGTTSVTGGTLTVQLDPAATIVSTAPATTPQGQTCTWSFTNLAPYASRAFDITLNLPLNVALGQAVASSAAVTPLANDVLPGDNVDTLRQIVVGSYDPNDIHVNYTSLTAAQISASVPLDYVVNFQNMGTDTAFAVLIQDSLPAALLQLATIEVLDQSHNVLWSFSGAGLLTLRFPDIKLPHRAVDAVGSQGFVRFRIVPRTTLAPGTIIPNRAHITFDYNAVESTNEVTTLVQNPNGLVAESSAATWCLYPNPATERVTLSADLVTGGQATVRVLDPLGRLVRELSLPVAAGAQRLTLNVRGLAPGLYVVRLTGPNGASTSQKLVVGEQR